MKRHTLLAALVLTGASSLAAADPYQSTSPRDKSLMLYFTKSFDSAASRRTPLAFGLRFEQSQTIRGAAPVALLDLRYRLDGTGVISAAGVGIHRFGSAGSSGESSEMARLHPGWTAAVIVVAVLAGSCASDNWPCESNGSSSYDVPQAE